MTDDDLTLLALVGRVQPPAPEVVERARRHLVALIAVAAPAANQGAAAAELVAVEDHPLHGAGAGSPGRAGPAAGELDPNDGTLDEKDQVIRLPARHYRRSRTRRRARIGATITAAVVVTAIVVAVIAIHSQPTVVQTSLGQPPVTLPTVKAPAGTKPLDFGRLRLYVPRAWAPTSCGTPNGGPGGTPYPSALQSYYVGPLSKCEGSRTTTGLTLAEASPKSPPPPWTPGRVNGIRAWSRQEGAVLLVDIPSLRVSIAAQGRAARAAVRSLGPSSLDALMAQTGPVAVPAGWKDVRFAGVQARVPPGWPVDAVTKERSMPGVCGDPIFGSSEVYLGDSGFDGVRCEATLPRLDLPTNGLWIDSKGLPPAGTRLDLAWASLPLTLRYRDNQTDDLAEVDTALGGRTVQLAIGLGTDPTVAEEILSSLTASTRAPSRPTVTNPSFSTVTYGRSGSTVTTRPRRRTSVPSGDGKT